MNKYLFIGGCGILGGLFYNSTQNLGISSVKYDYNPNIFNIGMLNGVFLGFAMHYTKVELNKLLNY
jgi:hypothetical protein